MQILLAILGTITGVIIGAVAGVLVDRKLRRAAARAGEKTGREMIDVARIETEKITSEAKLAAKDEMLRVRDEFEHSTREQRHEAQALDRKLKEREDKLDAKMDDVQRRLNELAEHDQQLTEAHQELKQRRVKLEEIIEQEVMQLERVAEMSREKAQEELLKKLDEELTHERGVMIRRSMEEVKQNCARETQKMMVQAMQRYAGDCSYDHSTYIVPLPSDDMKGRIIGREGRNIRVFEAKTGVNVLIDDTPSAVVVSCFEPIRREVARLALERLVADGRIHPSRVEEVVAKARTDVQSQIVKAGEDAIHGLRLSGTPRTVLEVLGRLKFRFSYSQNVLQHSIEVANFMGMIAAELGLDAVKAKRMGLFHDLGKALDHEKEGSHAILGMEFLKRHGEDPEVLNGVGCHHNDLPTETPLAALVNVCDALSASRPGARNDSTETYLKRLEQLEQIGQSFDGIESCYAIQAGREIRVIVSPGKVSEEQASELSRDLAKRIQDEMQYPGQIKVCVIRETRTVEYAK